MLKLTRGLIDIGNKTIKINKLESELYQYADPSPQSSDIIEQIKVELHQNLDLIDRLSQYLSGINESLGGGWYEKELEIIGNYNTTFTELYNSYTEDGESAD